MSYSSARIDRLRASMREQGLDAFFVRGTSNIHWLTAFDDVFDGEDAHALIITPNDAVLHTDTRYVQACLDAASGTGITVDCSSGTHIECALTVISDGRSGRAGEGRPFTIGIEDGIQLGEYRKIEQAVAKAAFPVGLQETEMVVLGLRAVKDEDEVRRLKAAQAITDAAFAHIVGFIRPGMTEREVQIELEGCMVRLGAEGLSFSSIVASGANGASPHAIPGAARLEAGQCVVLDFGARALGYCADMTRMVFLGEPDEGKRRVYEALRTANEEVARMLKPGVIGSEAHARAEQILAEAGFAGKMGHGLGHGVGIDVHEQPTLSPKNGKPLCAGNVVTVEPGVYLAGDFGMRLEDFGIITADGFEVFTQTNHEMVII